MLILNIGDWFNTTVHKLLLWIDGVVYWFAAQCYQLFMQLSTTRIFEDDFFANFANRIYAILGVVMLFYLAYSLLLALIDPDKFTKGDKGVSKIASNLVISLVILGFLPSIFNYAYRLQNYILSSDLIGALIVGNNIKDVNSDVENAHDPKLISYGNFLSFKVLNTFLNPQDKNFNMGDGRNNNYEWNQLKKDIIENGEFTKIHNMDEAVSNGVKIIGDSSGNQEVIDYKIIISTGAGIFLVYVMLSFTLDLGIRVVKFAFYQLVAPIPVIMRILPSKKGVFDKWLKQTLSVYFEVFIRVGVMYLAIYFIDAFISSEIFGANFSKSDLGILGGTIIILGILAFAKQAPKMISDLFGGLGGLKLGIGEKLKASGAPGKLINSAGMKVGKSITNTGAKAVGAVTGGLGAGLSGAYNGASFKTGFLYGANKGWNSKGGIQFNNQRKDMYSKLTGDMKGKPAYFGGASFGTRLNENMTSKATKEAKKYRESVIENFEKSTIEQESQRQVNEYNNRKAAFEAAKSQRLQDIDNQLNTEKQAFEKDKEMKIKNLTSKLVGNYSHGEALKIQGQLDAIRNSKYENPELLRERQSIQAQTFDEKFELNKTELDKAITKLQTDLEAKSKSGQLTELEAEYLNNKKISKKLGENSANAAQKKAFEQVLKDLGYKKEDKK